ncbi:pentatricopeptide repeat-containing protein, mitochondrial [Trifolium repens]|nr:pentatricopeptide repeat-containing protein, mitochondrial [Trifolium repens]
MSYKIIRLIQLTTVTKEINQASVMLNCRIDTIIPHHQVVQRPSFIQQTPSAASRKNTDKGYIIRPSLLPHFFKQVQSFNSKTVHCITSNNCIP